MAVSTFLYVTHDTEAPQTIIDRLIKPGAHAFVNALVTLFAGLGGGQYAGKIGVRIENTTSGSFATGTVTITHANIGANDTITIGGVVLTWKVAAGNENEITIGTDATTDGAALAAAINAHSKLSALLSAASVAGVVTITALVPGIIGSLITLATSDATAMALSPATALGNVTSVISSAPAVYRRGVA